MTGPASDGVPETHSVFLSSHTRAVLCCLDHCLSFCFHIKINYFQIWLKDFLWSHTKWAFMVFSRVGRWWCEMFPLYLINNICVQKASFIFICDHFLSFSFPPPIYFIISVFWPHPGDLLLISPLKLRGEFSLSFSWDGKIKKLSQLKRMFLHCFILLLVAYYSLRPDQKGDSYLAPVCHWW